MKEVEVHEHNNILFKTKNDLILHHNTIIHREAYEQLESLCGTISPQTIYSKIINNPEIIIDILNNLIDLKAEIKD
jgi:hypothetical protein